MTAFAELSNDVIRIICTYLDIESHISLYLATEFPATADQLTQKMQAANQTDLIYFVAMLPPHYQASLTRLFGGTIPFDFTDVFVKSQKTMCCLLPLLVDHQQLFEVKGKRVAAKRNHKKYGALRLEPSTQEFLENLVIQAVVNETILEEEFIEVAFDINRGLGTTDKKTPNCFTPNCFRDPVSVLDRIVAQMPEEWLLSLAVFYGRHMRKLQHAKKKNGKEAQERLDIVRNRLVNHLWKLPSSPWHYHDDQGHAHLLCPVKGECSCGHEKTQQDEEVFVGRKSYVYE